MPQDPSVFKGLIMNIKPPTFHSDTVRLAICALLLAALPLQVNAQTADLAEFPLARSSPASVRANMMFIMDDSGSMERTPCPIRATSAAIAWAFAASIGFFTIQA